MINVNTFDYFKQSRLNFYLSYIFLACLTYFTLLLITKYPQWRSQKYCDEKCIETLSKTVLDIEDFTGFDNINGRKDGRYVVPNYVHFLRNGDSKEIPFMEAVCLLAAMKNQKPSILFIHIDKWPKGKYWERLMNMKSFNNFILPVKDIKIPLVINGKNVHPSLIKNNYRSIKKLLILMKYGGIIIDNDSYIAKNLNDLRRYEMAMDDFQFGLRSHKTIIANKNSRLLKIWLNYYLDSYNQTSRLDLEKNVFNKNSDLFHKDKYFLANSLANMHYVYLYDWQSWRKHYVLHLNLESMHLLTKSKAANSQKYPVVFNESNINDYNVTIKHMVNDVMIIENGRIMTFPRIR